MLVCPGCHRLVHSETLARLAAEAEVAGQKGDAREALTLWRQVLDLLPPDTEQSRRIGVRVAELSRHAETIPEPAPARPAWAKAGTLAGTVGLVLWKFKVVLLLVLGKLKFLALGFTKMGTVLSMLLSFGVYWTVWGWRFALGLLLAVYVHEMGHVAALRRYGIMVTAPMFVPGLGAFVRLKQTLQSPREDARVGLAGPLWGLGATLVAYGAFLVTGMPVLSAIARFSAWVNLFNLLPVWQLDGGRAFASLSSLQRWCVAAVCGVAYAITKDGLLVLMLIAAGFRAWRVDPEVPPDGVVLVQYCGLVLALALLATIQVAVP
jgi:Zn-dependent protease